MVSKTNPKGQKSLKFAPSLKGISAIFDLSPFRNGAEKVENYGTGELTKVYSCVDTAVNHFS